MKGRIKMISLIGTLTSSKLLTLKLKVKKLEVEKSGKHKALNT